GCNRVDRFTGGNQVRIFVAGELRRKVKVLESLIVRYGHQVQSPILVLEIACNRHDLGGTYDPGIGLAVDDLLQGPRVIVQVSGVVGDIDVEPGKYRFRRIE